MSDRRTGKPQAEADWAHRERARRLDLANIRPAPGPYSDRMLRTPLPHSLSFVLCAAATSLLGVGISTPAYADVTTKKDAREDAPARLDIASVTYRNTTPQVTVRIGVPELTRAGRSEFYITTATGTDVAYVAIASIRPDGTLRKRFVERGNLDDTHLKCNFEARWKDNKNFVYISVPRSCVPNAGDGAHYMRADMSAFDTDERDYGPVAQHLGRD